MDDSSVDHSAAAAQRLVDRIYREEYPRILATIARLTGNLDLAEDAVQDAIGSAIANWSRVGPPDNPGAWLTTVARNRAIDMMRREGRRGDLEANSLEIHGAPPPGPGSSAGPRPPRPGGAGAEHGPTGPVVDDQLRLMFVTCHPSLTADTRIALTLKYVCGLRTHEIARVLLVGEDAVTKRIQRARRKIRDAQIPMRLPPTERLGERLRSVLECLYLVFTEGYAATAGDELVRADLCSEAIRLTRLAAGISPSSGSATSDPAAVSLLALELLQDSRSATRTDADGRPVLLADQDRSLWNRDQVDEALGLIEAARRTRERSAVADSYLLQAIIAAEHATAPAWEQTDWTRICNAYDQLYELTGSPVVGLNRVVARSMLAGPGSALELLEEIDADERLVRSHHWQLVRADLLERLGDEPGAAEAYHAAQLASTNEPEREFIAQRRSRSTP